VPTNIKGWDEALGGLNVSERLAIFCEMPLESWDAIIEEMKAAKIPSKDFLWGLKDENGENIYVWISRLIKAMDRMSKKEGKINDSQALEYIKKLSEPEVNEIKKSAFSDRHDTNAMWRIIITSDYAIDLIKWMSGVGVKLSEFAASSAAKNLYSDADMLKLYYLNNDSEAKLDEAIAISHKLIKENKSTGGSCDLLKSICGGIEKYAKDFMERESMKSVSKKSLYEEKKKSVLEKLLLTIEVGAIDVDTNAKKKKSI
jgi:hypothetical protein